MIFFFRVLRTILSTQSLPHRDFSQFRKSSRLFSFLTRSTLDAIFQLITTSLYNHIHICAPSLTILMATLSLALISLLNDSGADCYRTLSEVSLYEVQLRKLKRVIDKSKISSGQRVLEIGSGWDFMAIAIAQACPPIDALTLPSNRH